MNDRLDKHVLGTYLSLRIGVAVIAVCFPFLLWIGGRIYVGLPLQDSMSAYYHATVDGRSMRDWFVGILFAVGVFLYLYKGYSRIENYVLNFAGVMALGIAIFPMEWACSESCAKLSVHGFCAILFFLCIAFVCVRCSRDTLRLLEDPEVQASYRRRYQVLAVLMIVSPAIALLVNTLFRQYGSLVFYVEAAGIFAFAAYWLTKSREIALTESEARALRGEL